MKPSNTYPVTVNMRWLKLTPVLFQASWDWESAGPQTASSLPLYFQLHSLESVMARARWIAGDSELSPPSQQLQASPRHTAGLTSAIEAFKVHLLLLITEYLQLGNL